MVERRRSEVAVTALRAAVKTSCDLVEIRRVERAGDGIPGAMSRPAGPFMFDAVGDGTDPGRQQDDFALLLGRIALADVGLSLGSWLDRRDAATEALPERVRSRVEAVRRGIDPDGVIAPTRFTALTGD